MRYFNSAVASPFVLETVGPYSIYLHVTRESLVMMCSVLCWCIIPRLHEILKVYTFTLPDRKAEWVVGELLSRESSDSR